ncbi:MAG: MAPEG family protein [Deltaproteobacteria bacterium]|nr:MAPEG family protein [Deltaproteobacteria bacterium]
MNATLLSAVVTVLIVLTYFYMSTTVAQMRGKHGIKAPAMTGHPEMERAVRVHYNTLEQMPVILPLLWLATTYFHMLAWAPALFGLVWIVGRFIYKSAYMADPDKRGTGFLIAGIATLGLLLMTIVGLVQSAMAVNAA